MRSALENAAAQQAKAEAARAEETASLRSALTGTSSELAQVREQSAEALRELELRARQLEAEKAALAADTVAREEFVRVAVAQAETEGKLAAALRAQAVVAGERDELRVLVASISSRLTPAAAATLRSTETNGTSPVPRTQPLRAQPARTSTPVPAARPVAPVRVRPASFVGEAALTHRIAPGETLSAIALRYYGKADRWPEIVAANRDVLTDQRSFTAGQMLRIP